MSSANTSNLLETSDRSSLTYRANNKGLRADPWGTPLLILSQDDNVLLTFTHWCPPIKKLLNQTRSLPVIPYASSFNKSLEWGKLSKDLKNQNKLQ